MTIAQILFSFSGRINRAKYWLTVLLTIAVMLALIFVVVLAAPPTAEVFGRPFLLPLLMLLYIPMLWIALAVGVKRLHDRNKSGWWLLFFYLVPAVLQGIGDLLEAPLSLVLYLPAFAIGIWCLIELGFLRGTDGPNQYGPDPLQSASATQPA